MGIAPAETLKHGSECIYSFSCFLYIKCFLKGSDNN